LTIEDSGTTAEIAAVMNYTNTMYEDTQSQKMMVIRQDGENQGISTISRLWEPLAYPLLFLHAMLGWGIVGSADDIESGLISHTQDEGKTSTRQIMYYDAHVLRKPCFCIFGCLTNEYLVDMFSRNLETRLNYICVNQKRL
jgi:hypothetical protein